MSERMRPLSPHLSIYKLPISANLSILHRFTGIALFIGTLVLCWFVIFTVYSVFDINVIFNNWFFHNIVWNTILFGWSFSLFYHLCNGIRHIYWDMGYGFRLKSVRLSSWFILIFSLVLTIVSWLISFKIM